MFKILKLFVPVFLSLIVIACAETPLYESTGEYLDSSAVTAKVKAKLVDNLGTRGFAIQVKTFKEEVQLSGFVDNASIRQKAGRIALTVAGVKHVRNDLIVKRRE